MNPVSLANFAAFLIYILLILFILSKNPRASINLVCSLFISCFAIWSFSTIFIQSAITKNDAMFWTNFSSFGWCSFPSFYLLFSFIFTRKEKILKKWYFYSFFFLISAFFVYMQWNGYLVSDIINKINGWSPVLSVSIWVFIYYAYYIFFSIISIILCYNYGRKTKLFNEKKQAYIIVTTSVITIILSTITDVLLPQCQG